MILNTAISIELDDEPIAGKTAGNSMDGEMLTSPPLASISAESIDIVRNNSHPIETIIETEAFAPASVTGSEILDQVLGKLEHETEPRSRHLQSSSRNTGTHGCVFSSDGPVTIAPGRNIVKISIPSPMRLEI